MDTHRAVDDPVVVDLWTATESENVARYGNRGAHLALLDMPPEPASPSPDPIRPVPENPGGDEEFNGQMSTSAMRSTTEPKQTGSRVSRPAKLNPVVRPQTQKHVPVATPGAPAGQRTPAEWS